MRGREEEGGAYGGEVVVAGAEGAALVVGASHRGSHAVLGESIRNEYRGEKEVERTRAKWPREPQPEHTSETGQLRASWSPSTSPQVKHL